MLNSKTMNIPAGTRQASLEQTVTRCMCGNPDGHRGEVCPEGQQEVIGLAAYWHVDWKVRLAYWFLRKACGYRLTLNILGKE